MSATLIDVTREPQSGHRPSAIRLGESLVRSNTGASMQLAQVLDVVEGLLRASRHPDIVTVRRYGADTVPGGRSPAGVAVKHVNGSEAYLAGSTHPGETPLPIPEVLPSPRLRAPRLAILVAQLLDAAQPEQFQEWRLVGFPDVGPTDQRGELPYGVSILCQDDTRMLLQATHGSGPAGDPGEDPSPDYTIPEEVKSWHLKADAPSAAHG